METIGIFLSSTIDDLRKERKAIAESINFRQECKAVYAESFSASTLSSEQVCLEAVRRCNIYVGIFKNKYGFVPIKNNPNGFCVTALEYYEAKANGLSILIFVDEEADGVEDKLSVFLKEIMDFNNGHFIKFYSNLSDLVRFVLEAIDNEIVQDRFKARMRAMRVEQAQKIYELPYFIRLRERL